jgi:hypothetical protein
MERSAASLFAAVTGGGGGQSLATPSAPARPTDAVLRCSNAHAGSSIHFVTGWPCSSAISWMMGSTRGRSGRCPARLARSSSNRVKGCHRRLDGVAFSVPAEIAIRPLSRAAVNRETGTVHAKPGGIRMTDGLRKAPVGSFGLFRAPDRAGDSVWRRRPRTEQVRAGKGSDRDREGRQQ